MEEDKLHFSHVIFLYLQKDDIKTRKNMFLLWRWFHSWVIKKFSKFRSGHFHLKKQKRHLERQNTIPVYPLLLMTNLKYWQKYSRFHNTNMAEIIHIFNMNFIRDLKSQNRYILKKNNHGRWKRIWSEKSNRKTKWITVNQRKRRFAPEQCDAVYLVELRGHCLYRIDFA